ncbi:SET domain-containing protein 5 [Colletotrichum shisoi]|uniref:SET domain-containing protein 5 n=1 Tax=Colletotrichum shisoi TaxID=2078593 RepID=A0A5Q4BLD3_9PEZI|nr:SET domain-containing protein 5 [Colletotrichum shisoi]
MLIDWDGLEDFSSEELQNALLESAVEKLPKTTRQTVLELYGGTENTYKKRMTINGYSVSNEPAEDKKESDDGVDRGMVAVHANISKINHSCRPNAVPQWDWDLLAHKLHAVRDIAAGEEITMSYFDTLQTRLERQQYTQDNLGFECACSQCKIAGHLANLSDDRINEIRLLEEYLENRQIAPAEPTAMADLLVSLYEQEGLESVIGRAYAIAAREWNGVGHEYQARSWAYRSVKAALISSPETRWDDDLEDMEALLDGARKHWSWKYRVRQ